MNLSTRRKHFVSVEMQLIFTAFLFSLDTFLGGHTKICRHTKHLYKCRNFDNSENTQKMPLLCPPLFCENCSYLKLLDNELDSVKQPSFFSMKRFFTKQFLFHTSAYNFLPVELSQSLLRAPFL